MCDENKNIFNNQTIEKGRKRPFFNEIFKIKICLFLTSIRKDLKL